MSRYIHIGGKIEELLEEQHKTKRELGFDIGMSPSNVVYLCGKESMDVQTLHKIGNALQYNFFKHFVIDEGEQTEAVVLSNEKKLLEEKEVEIAGLKEMIAAQERLIESSVRDIEILKQENGYLKEINGLLKAATQQKK